jgi:GNAT superfamily N-acetyltransferase
MPDVPAPACTIRRIRPEEMAEFGRLLVDVYAALPGMPTPAEQPAYYERLRDVAKRDANPAIRVLVAVGEDGGLLGGVDFIADMRAYGSGGTAGEVPDAAGIRLLAVAPAARGLGLGGALTRHCLGEARALGRAQVVLHTTRAMAAAWAMYERMGFERRPDLDFLQGRLEVFGFGLLLDRART